MTKVALVQFKASTKKEENLKKIINFIREASKKGAKLIAFPEFMMFYTTSSQTSKDLVSQAEKLDEKFVSEIAKAAKENSIEVVGTMYEKSSKNNRVYDTAFLIDQKGKIVSVYRKIHLYDALGFKESNKLEPGSSITHPVNSKIGKLGMMICYDLRFPEMSRTLSSLGSQVLIAPSAWVKGDQKIEHWLTINKTRAIENSCYVIAPDQIGNIYCGHSLVVDPFGKILVDMKNKEGFAIVEISMAYVKKIRKSLPLLKNRRTDIYTDFK